MNFVIPYYTIFTTFAIYTYNVDTLDYIFIADYVLSCIETFLLICLILVHYKQPDLTKTKKVLICCILKFGIVSFIYYLTLTLVCVPTFDICNLKLYITRSILLFIQIILMCMFPIKFPIVPVGSPVVDSSPPPYVEYTPV